jgi:two-component system response regulator PilR (NtrC family)
VASDALPLRQLPQPLLDPLVETLALGSGTIEAEHIRLRAAPRAGTSAAPSPAHASAAARSEAAGGLSDQIEHLERDAIIKALEQTRYNKTAAAKLLGVTYRALRYKIQKLEIE